MSEHSFDQELILSIVCHKDGKYIFEWERNITRDVQKTTENEDTDDAFMRLSRAEISQLRPFISSISGDGSECEHTCSEVKLDVTIRNLSEEEGEAEKLFATIILFPCRACHTPPPTGVALGLAQENPAQQAQLHVD